MLLALLFVIGTQAQELPGPPSSRTHPGSKAYDFAVEQRDITCEGRDVSVFIPSPLPERPLPLVIYGHGQALGVDHYEATLRHLAEKGAIAIHPQYDKGFFDQNWLRMGRDFVTVTHCAVQQLALSVNEQAVVFSGHSKGAYVASVAAGLAFKDSLALKPGSVVLFQPAGLNDVWKNLDAETEVTVVHSEADKIVSRDISRDLFEKAPVRQKQLIILKNYRSQSRDQLVADHFWPLTKKSLVGGGPESSFHYHGSWKWLTAAFMDLSEGGDAKHPYLYGEEARSKGREGEVDDIERSP